MLKILIKIVLAIDDFETSRGMPSPSCPPPGL
jgi:hypothetical protein